MVLRQSANFGRPRHRSPYSFAKTATTYRSAAPYGVAASDIAMYASLDVIVRMTFD